MGKKRDPGNGLGSVLVGNVYLSSWGLSEMICYFGRSFRSCQKLISGLKHVTPIDFFGRDHTNVQFDKYQIWVMIQTNEPINACENCEIWGEGILQQMNIQTL